MKKLLVLLVLITTKVNAFPVPDYLVDGVITVTTKSGETYVYSSNEYKVVRRTKKEALPKEQGQIVVRSEPVKEERSRHILSGYLVRSQNGLESNVQGLTGEIKSTYGLGAGLMYQYRFTDMLYIGGGFDTNGGKMIMLGSEL